MEIYLFDEEYMMEVIADNPISVIWHRKYYDAGDFEIHLSEEYQAARGMPYLRIPGFKEFGLIENTTWNPETHTVMLAGSFFEKTLEDSVIPVMQNFTGRPEEIIHTLITDYYTPPDAATTGVTLPLSGIGDSITTQLGESTLKPLCYELAQLEEQSISFSFQGNEANHYFSLPIEIWQGKDRTRNQDVNPVVRFSDEDIASFSRYYDRRDYKNVIYISGEDLSGNQVLEMVSVQGRVYGRSESAREMFFKSDVQMEEDMSLDQYRALLKQRGLEKLMEYTRVSYTEIELNPYGNYRYKEDFDLGDKCDVYIKTAAGSTSISSERITEITEVYENNTLNLSLVLGSANKTIMEKVYREVH